MVGKQVGRAAWRIGMSAIVGAALCAGLPAEPAAAALSPSMRADGAPISRIGRWLVDDQGRVVVLHGVNLVQKNAPFYTDVVDDQGARFLADEGFNAAREGIIWEGLEPQPGQYDATYVGKLAALNETLGNYGIRTLLDLHQDAWSAHTATGPLGFGDGAPQWATPHPGLLDDFQSFWDNDNAPDGRPLQAHFTDALKQIARSPLGTSSNVLGYDPFNEPYAGTKSACVPFTPCPAFESGELAAFYRAAIAAIRQVDGRHVIFPEGVAQNGVIPPTLPPFNDPQTAFNFHYYCPMTQLSSQSNPIEAAYCTADEQHGLGNFEAYARKLGVPAILSEFGGSAPADDLHRVVQAAGGQFLSWTQWAYQNDFKDPSQPFSEANANQQELDALVVPYPQAIAGTPGTWNFDYASNVMTLSYQASAIPGARLNPGAPTRIFVPERKYPTGYAVSVTGARVVSGPTDPWVQLSAPAPGATVTVTIRPRTGSFTQTPLQSGAVPLSGPNGSGQPW